MVEGERVNIFFYVLYSELHNLLNNKTLICKTVLVTLCTMGFKLYSKFPLNFFDSILFSKWSYQITVADRENKLQKNH